MKVDLSVYSGIFGSFKEIVNGYIEIVCDFYEDAVACFTLARFVAADAVLVHV